MNIKTEEDVRRRAADIAERVMNESEASGDQAVLIYAAAHLGARYALREAHGITGREHEDMTGRLAG